MNCKRCGKSNFHIETKSNNTGLYCNNCGTWQKWLNKNEIRTFEYSLKDSKNTSYSSLTDRLQRLITDIDNEIDKEYAVLPVNDNDCIRKNAYCYALDKCKMAIIKILDGGEYYDKDDI